MRKYLIIFAIVVLGLIVSVMLLPDSSEMALMQYRDKRFEASKQAYEKHLNEGTLTVDVARTLTDLYLQYGAVDEAIKIMERFSTENPENILALKELGKLYQYAQRPDDYLRTLEKITELEGQEKDVAKLVELYGASAKYDEQGEALEKLTDDPKAPNSAERYRYLASLQASKGEKIEAVGTLMRMRDEFPQMLVFSDIELLVTLMLETGQREEAYEVAKFHALQLQEAAHIARLINILHFKGDSELAWQLVTLYAQQADEVPLLMIEKAHLHLARGEEDQAYALIEKLYVQGLLPAGLNRQYMFLSLKRGKIGVASQVVDRIDFKSMNEREAMEMLEILVLKDAPTITNKITHKYETSGLTKRFPAVNASLKAVNNSPDTAKAVAELKDQSIDNISLVQLAYILGEKKRVNEARMLLNRIQAPVGDRQLALRAAELQLLYGATAQADKLIEPFLKQNPSDPKLTWIKVRIAAANDDIAYIDQWLQMKTHLTQKQYKELYFSAHDRNAHQTAAKIAQGYYTQYKNDESRSMVVNAYMLAKDYEAALPLLREVKGHSEQSRNDYLAVLMKLAAQNGRYNGELIQFASKELQDPSIPKRQKQALIYALLDAGRGDLALPHIRKLALEQGGDWIYVYTENLEKAGNHDEANAFREQLAGDPNTPDELRRQMGHVLLAKGKPNAALKAFARLATNAEPESSDTKQLLYIWGPRLTDHQLDWLTYRAVHAETLDEQDKWLEYVVNYADAQSLVRFIERSPEMASHPVIVGPYIAALKRMDYELLARDTIVQMVDETEDVYTLRAVANAASSNGFIRESTQAYMKLETITGGDTEAERNIGLQAYTLADYSMVKEVLAPYAQERLNENRFHKDDYNTFYYLAQTYQRDDEEGRAREAYEMAIKLSQGVSQQTTDTYSKRAQSLVALGRKEEGYSQFEEALEMYPNDPYLTADYISSMIEAKDYAIAETMLSDLRAANVVSENDTERVVMPPMYVAAGQLTGYRSYGQGREIMLEFGNQKADLTPFESSAYLDEYSWLAYATRSHDRVLITAKPGHELTLVPLDSGYEIYARKTYNENDPYGLDSALSARLVMLQARIDLETGEHYKAGEDLKEMLPYYSENTTFVGYAANAEYYNGRWKRALQLLELAQSRLPENEDIEKLRRDIYLRHSQHVTLDHEWYRIGDSEEHISTLSGMAFIDDTLEIGFELQNNEIDAENVVRIDGRVGNFDESKQRGEIYLANEDEDGNRAQVSVFGNNDTVGAGLYYSWFHEFGQTKLHAEYHRPNWLFVEGVLDDATRDRVAISHNYRPAPKWLVNGSVGFNQYNLEDNDNVAQSVSGTASVTRELMNKGPYLAVNYAVDAEYRTDEKIYLDQNGVPYAPLLDSREVHALSLLLEEQFGMSTTLQLQGGYTYERLSGDNGPLVAGKINQQLFEDRLQAQIRASYGAFTSDNVGDTARVGGHLKWRF